MVDWHNYTDESEVIDLFPDSIELDFKDGKKTIPLKVDGALFVAHLPVVVPLFPPYCKLKDYDGCAEVLSCMGLGLRIGKAIIKPPSLGVFSLMEMTNNPFPVDFSKTTDIQRFHVLYFNEYRRKAAALVRDWHYADDVEFVYEDKSTWSPLDIASMIYVDKLGDQGVNLDDLNTWVSILELFGTANNGFEMVPGGGTSKFWFGAESFGTMVAGLGQDLNCTLDQIIWDTPLAQIGFAYVGKARSNGTKGVSRPVDRADVRRNRILAYLREQYGELHPWQIDRPLKFNLTPTQQNNKDCVKRFEQLRELANPKKANK